MAELTTQLGDINYTPPVRDPGGSPSSAAPIANLFSNVLQSFEQTSRERSARKAREAQLARQQAEETRAAQGREAYRATIMGLQDINAQQDQPTPVLQPQTGSQDSEQVSSVFAFEDPKNLDVPLQREIGNVANRVKSMQTASEQGRVPSLSVAARTEQLVRGLLNKYPDSAKTVIEALGDSGVKSTFLQELQDEQAQHKFALEEGLKFEQSNYERGMQVTPPEMLGNMTRDDIVAAGIRASHNEYQLDQLTKQAELRSKQVSTDAALNTQRQDDLNRGVAQTLILDAYNTAGPLMTSLNKQLVTIKSLPQSEQAQAFNSIGTQINAIAQRQIQEARAKAVAAGMDPQRVESFVNQVSGVWNQAKGMFSGDFSVAQQQVNTLNNFKTALKLDAIDSGKMMRAYFGLQQLGFGADVLNNFVTGIGSDPTLMKQFRDEVMGFVEDFDDNRASSRILNLGKLLRGESTLAGADSNTLRQQLPALMKTTLGNAQSYLNNRSADTGDSVLNGVSNIVIATQTLTPSSGLNAFEAATNGFAGSVPRAAIAIAAAQGEGGLREDARQVVIASQAASARMLDLMRPGLERANIAGWRVKFNEKTGKYEADGTNAVNVPRPLAPGLMFSNPGSSQRAAMPDAIRKWVTLANTHLDNAVRLNAPQINDNPIKGTALEAAAFFAVNKPTKAMQQEQQQTGTRRSAEGQARDALRGIQNALDQELGRAFEPVSMIDQIAGVEGMGKDPNSSAQAGFIDSTWLSIIKKNRSDIAQGKSDSEILALRSDPSLVRQAIGFYARDNAQVLADNGITPSAGNLNLMHLYGPGEGVRVLSAPGDTPIESLVSSRTLGANSWMRGKTVNQIRQIRKANG